VQDVIYVGRARLHHHQELCARERLQSASVSSAACHQLYSIPDLTAVCRMPGRMHEQHVYVGLRPDLEAVQRESVGVQGINAGAPRRRRQLSRDGMQRVPGEQTRFQT
jgi:hypothetical protein